MFSRRGASIFIAFLLAVTGLDIATGLEHWPFGSYPMYSLLYAKGISSFRLYAVDGSRETLLRGDRNFFPFDEARLDSALAHLVESDRDRPAASAALLNLLPLLQRNTGTSVRTLRLYSVSWTLHNGATGNEPPDQRTLLAEASVN